MSILLRDAAAMQAVVFGASSNPDWQAMLYGAASLAADPIPNECFGCERNVPTEHHDWDRNPICARCAARLDGDR